MAIRPPIPSSPRLDPDQSPRALFVLEERYPAGDGPWHEHQRAQLMYASEGVVTVHTRAGRWVVPPNRAVWIPPRTPHRVSSRGGFWLRTLYARKGLVALPPVCRVVAVDALARELLVAASAFGDRYRPGGPDARLLRVLVERLPSLNVAPLEVPLPRDPGLAPLVAAITQAPDDERTMAQVARAHGFTERTLARRFLRETGLTFGRWRQQVRVLTALEWLGAGHSVTRAALEVGYLDVSAFIAAFKATLGTTPARYFSAGSPTGPSPSPRRRPRP
ncbi:MAG: helix-turn-helix transcriptional regulator [Myxococcaceae bacterium]|nr:helix-turn-helix transcriptional regulator [Myxococcaceae bacterium]